MIRGVLMKKDKISIISIIIIILLFGLMPLKHIMFNTEINFLSYILNLLLVIFFFILNIKV